MTCEELIIKTEHLIKTVPQIKERINNINTRIVKNNMNAELLIDEKKLLEIKIQKLKNSMSVLTEEEQQIICYKYFENMANTKISRLIHRGYNYCNSDRIREILVKIGKITFVGDIILEGLEE